MHAVYHWMLQPVRYKKRTYFSVYKIIMVCLQLLLKLPNKMLLFLGVSTLSRIVPLIRTCHDMVVLYLHMNPWFLTSEHVLSSEIFSVSNHTAFYAQPGRKKVCVVKLTNITRWRYWQIFELFKKLAYYRLPWSLEMEASSEINGKGQPGRRQSKGRATPKPTN